jgi:uncharacterized damage-inducible protein DinB
MADAYFNLLARYNEWANERLYTACAQLDESDLKAARPAFFGSIHATLNHILVADRLWTSRLAGGSLTLALNAILYKDLAPLRAARRAQDTLLRELVGAIAVLQLDEALVYRNTRGEELATPTRLVLGHLFNHQTHHRGQIHDMLSQTAVAPPELDLMIFVRTAGDA